jgi:bifunctional non-homologous end joining protein LigD
LLSGFRRSQQLQKPVVSAETAGFYAFDLLILDGKDLRFLPLLERKRRLLTRMPRGGCRLLYLDHIQERGCDLFAAACARDLEGIVAKWAAGTYQGDSRSGSGSV